jgi:3-dehydroquinate synthase
MDNPGKKWTIRTHLPVEFTVQAMDDLFDDTQTVLIRGASAGKKIRRLIIIDEQVYSLHGERIEQYFLRNNVHYKIVPIIASETTKDIDNLSAILHAMENFQLMRQSEPVIVIGGGVLLDLAGFAASIYRRGVPYIKVPTTLVGFVDVSIAAKTAINYFGKRNRLGAYYPPMAVYLDRSFLKTLKRRDFSNGLGEILKMALIKDARLFELLEAHGKELIEQKFQNGRIASDVIDRSIQTMLEELEPNLWEKNLKRSVDFGHSFSPVIEMRALPDLYHGEAVAIDMLLSCIISSQRGLLSKGELGRIFKTARHLELPTFHPMFGDPKILKEALADTMIHRNGDQNLPMVPKIGQFTFFNDVSDGEIAKAASTLVEMNKTDGEG